MSCDDDVNNIRIQTQLEHMKRLVISKVRYTPIATLQSGQISGQRT